MKEKNNSRGAVLAVIFVSTLLFALCAGGLYYYVKLLPLEREHRVADALMARDTVLARELCEKLDDEELARGYLAQADYIDAQELMKAGAWLEAESMFISISDVDDAAQLARRCRYNYAAELFADGDYISAEEEFRALGGFEDAADRLDECRYMRALELRDGGRLTESLELLFELGKYRDAPKLIENIALEVTGESDAELAVAMLSGMSAEDIARQAELARVRASLPSGTVAAGFYHTAAVSSSGEVFACGDNSFGQCDTEDIKNAVAVAAGAYHTAVLLEDGSVKCVGRSSEGQCDTGDWSGIIAIAAGDWATLGLKSDGSIIYAGYNESQEICSWSGIESLYADSHAVCARRSNGAVFIYPNQTGAENLGSVLEAVCSTGFAAGMRADGSVVCTRADTSALNDAVAISASPNGIIILKADGSADGFFFMQRNAIPLELPGKAIALDAGATHIVFLLEDGSVYTAGDNSCGQCETGLWKLN